MNKNRNKPPTENYTMATFGYPRINKTMNVDHQPVLTMIT